MACRAASNGRGALGAAAIVYGATATGQRAADLIHAGNRIGGQSEILHFGGRNLGMLAGAELGAAAGAALGVESGTGLLATGAVGGIAGAIGGNKIADAIDHRRTYNQPDSHGSTWPFDPAQPAQGWTRQEQHRTLTADATLSNQLNFQASSTAVQLALKTPDTVILASDGHTYARAADGQWNTPGTLWGTHTANGNLRDELDATRPAQAARAIHGAAAAAQPRLDQPAHPDHPFYQQARSAVHRVDAEIGHTPDQKSDNLSSVAVAARRSDLNQIDHVVLSEDGSTAFAVQGELRSLTQQIAQPVDTTQAVQTSIAQSAASMARVNQQQAQAPTAAQLTPEAQPSRSATPLSR